MCNAREGNFTSLGLLPLTVSIILIVPVSVCAVGEKMDLLKKCMDCLAFTVCVKAPFQFPRLN